MLKFRIATLVFCIAVVLAALFFNHIIIWLVILTGYAAYLAYGASVISSGVFISATCHGDRSKKQVALTFDDGPDPVSTPEVLSILKSAGIKAAFFVIGEKIVRYPGLAYRLHENGHLIGNHSLSHSAFFPLKPAGKIRKELLATRALIGKITGNGDLCFRPPFGVTNPLIARALKGLNYRVVGWSIRSFDLSRRRPEVIANRILSKLRGGDIILLHDASDRIVPVLGRLLEGLREQGWEIVRLDRLEGFQKEVSKGSG